MTFQNRNYLAVFELASLRNANDVMFNLVRGANFPSHTWGLLFALLSTEAPWD
jgi:hypothetical protein